MFTRFDVRANLDYIPEYKPVENPPSPDYKVNLFILKINILLLLLLFYGGRRWGAFLLHYNYHVLITHRIVT